MNVNSGNQNTNSSEAAQPTVFDIRHLSEAQLAQLGVAQIAYVRPVLVDGVAAFAIHAADGTAVALTEDYMQAVEAIREHEMFPVSVH